MDAREHAQQIYTALILAWMNTHPHNPGPGDLKNWSKVAWDAALAFEQHPPTVRVDI